MDYFFLKSFPNSPDPEEAKGCENPHTTTARMFPNVFPSSSQFVHIKFQPCSQYVTQYVPSKHHNCIPYHLPKVELSHKPT
jgi:hypothetical protein